MLGTKTEYQLYHEDWDFIEINYDALQEKYPEHWIAMMNKKIVAADLDPMKLATKLRPMNLPPNRVVIEKLTGLSDNTVIVTSNFRC